MKKNSIFLIILFFFLLVVTSYSALAGSGLFCVIKDSSSCSSADGSISLLYLNNYSSGYDNAHAQLSSVGTYPYVLCCKPDGVSDGLSEDCNGTKVLNLYNQTNSHAQQGVLTTYNHSVCLKATLNTISCSYDDYCEDNTECLLSMSNSTNAHLGSCGEYGTNICCRIDSNETTTGGAGGGDDGGSCQPGYHKDAFGYCLLDEKPTPEQYQENVEQSVSNFINLKWVSSTLDFLKNNMIIAASLGIILLVFSYNNKTKKFRKTPFVLGIITIILATTSLWWKYVQKALEWNTPIVLGSLGLLIVILSYNWTTKKFNKTSTAIGVIVTLVASSQYWIKYFDGIINPIISFFVKIIFWLGNLFDASNPALIGTIVFLTAVALVIGGATYVTKQQAGGN